MSESEIPFRDQVRAAIDPYLGGVLIEGIECGLYTVILLQALWKLHRKGGKVIYSSALLVLWVAVILSFAGDFYNVRMSFVFNNDTPEAIDYSLGTTLSLPWYIPGLIAITLSDAILIWRCHTLWNNKYILALLSFLLCATFGLTLCDDIAATFAGDKAESVAVFTQAFALLSSFLTTVSATFLIALKIILVTRGSPVRRSYTRIIDIIVQSAAPLSVVLLIFAVLNLNSLAHSLSLETRHDQSVYALSVYLQMIQLPISGIAPTLIAFRVADEEHQVAGVSSDRTSPLSRLTFGRANQSSTVGTGDSDISASEMGGGRAGLAEWSDVPPKTHSEKHIELEAGSKDASTLV